MRVSCYILCCRLGPYSRTAHAFSAREVVFEERVASQCEMSEDQAWNTAENDKEVFSEHGKEGEEEVAEGEDNEDEVRLMKIEHRIMMNEFPIARRTVRFSGNSLRIVSRWSTFAHGARPYWFLLVHFRARRTVRSRCFF